MNQHDLIVEPKYQVGLCKDILRDFSKKTVIEPQVKFYKRDAITRIENIDETLDESINELRKVFDKELEKIMILDDIAVNFAIQEKLEQIWKFQASRFIKTIKDDYINRKQIEQNLMNLLNLIFLIIKRQNQIGQSCNYFLYLWRQTKESPSIFDMFVYCDDWELNYRIIQILQDMKFEEQRKYSIKQSIVQHSFEEQIHMGFYLFTNIVIAMTSQNHFHHKNRYISLVEYQFNQVILLKKRDSQSYLVTNIQNLKEEEGDIIFRFDVSNPSKQQRKLCLWESFIQTIGKQTYLDCNTNQKQLELFEAFIEYKYAILCKENFIQAAYFQIFYKRLASFASSNKISTLKNFCLQYMKKEIHFNYVSRQSIQNFSLNLIRDLLDKMDEKGWILKRNDDVSNQELIELQKDQLFRLAWDIILFENANIIHFLQEQYKIENELFGKIEDFIFQYYLNTKQNAYIYWESDMQFPNGVNIDTSSGFFQLFFQQFKTNYEKVIFTNDSCPKRQKMQEYDNRIQNWQIKILTNIITNPESFNGKQGILSSIQFHELIRRYNENFRSSITEKFKEIFILLLDQCIDKKECNKLNDIFIHRMMLICCQQLTDQKRMEIFQQKGIDYIEKLFLSILKENKTISAFTFLMLLEQGSELFKNQLIEFIISSEKSPSFQIVDGKILPFFEEINENSQQSNNSESKQVKQENIEQVLNENVINDQKQQQVTKQNEIQNVQLINDQKKSEFQKIRKQQILNIAESLIRDYGFCYDIFMNLSKTDAFNLSSKQDVDRNQEIYALYVKYYAQIYLNKGTIMMHSQFFNQPGVKLQLRNQMLKTGVIESLIQRIYEDHEAEMEYYIKEIKVNSERICRVAYKMMINAKYTFLIHNLKQYIDTTMILCNSSASSDEKKEIKQDIIKHAFLVLRLILTLNSIFTYSFSTSLSYLSNIRITALRFVEIMTQNGSEDIDFNLLFCSLFSGLDFNEKQTSQVLSAASIDMNNAIEFNQSTLKFNKDNIFKLFDNFQLISKFYYNQDETILRLSSIEEVNLIKKARQIETIAFIIKKIIKSLNDSNKKSLIQKYFTKHHIKYVQNSFKIASIIQRKYVEELFNLKMEDIMFTDPKELQQSIQKQEQIQILQSKSQLLIKQIEDEEVLKFLYKRIKCFVNITRFGLSLDIHGNSAEQMQVFVTFRDSIIESYNYVFFGTISAPTIKRKSKNIKKVMKEFQQINKQNKQIFNELNSSQSSPKVKINKKRKKIEDCKGLYKYTKNKSTSQSQKIIIHQFVCMKYFTSLQKMFHFHIQAQQKVILKKEKPVIFIESNRFIKSITYLFKHSMDHIKECKQIFQKNSNQFQFTQIGGAGGGASTNITQSYLEVQTYSKKSCLSMSNFSQLLFQEFALFLTTRFPLKSCLETQENNKANKNQQEEKIPLLSDHSKSAGSLDIETIDRRYQNLDDICIQDDTLSDDCESNQFSSTSSNQNIQFCDDDLTNQCDEDYGIGYIDVSESDEFSQQDIGISCSLDYEIGEEVLENENDSIYENNQDNQNIEDIEDSEDISVESYNQNPINILKFKKQSSQKNQFPNLFQQTSNLSNQFIDSPSNLINQSSNQSDLQNKVFNQSKFSLKVGDSIIDDEQSEEYYLKSLENELQEIRQNQQINDNKIISQQVKDSLFNIKYNKENRIQAHIENEKILISNDALQIQQKQSEIKNKEIKKKQKYEIYFAKLKYLISIIMNNLSQIESCDVNQILQKITEKQIGAKIDRIKAVQFFDTVFGSIESFDLGEAIQFKQFFNKFYYPTLSDELQQPITLSSKSKSANLEQEYHSININSQSKKYQEQDQIEESKQDQNTQNESQNRSFEICNIKQKIVKDLIQKKREIKFNKIQKQLQQKIKKNKLTFLDITLLNSNSQEQNTQNQNYILKYIKEELLPHLNDIHSQIEQINNQEQNKQNQNSINVNQNYDNLNEQSKQSKQQDDQNKFQQNLNQIQQNENNLNEKQTKQNQNQQQNQKQYTNTQDQQCEQQNEQQDENNQQTKNQLNGLELKSIEDLITERRKHIISITVTLQVISYYLQFFTVKEEEKDKIEQIFTVMSQSIDIFSQCKEIIKSDSFFMNETLYYQQQTQKKISQIHQNLTQRFLNLSFQFILTARQQSIKLFIDHNILSITSNISMPSVDTFRNAISLSIFSIIYEIFNTPYIYYNTIEFSLKNYIFQQSKNDYQSFSFENKYSQPIDIQSYQNEAKSLIMKGPKDFMKAFQNIMGIEKLRKQKLKCYVKKKYQNQWCYPIKFDEFQLKVIEQLYDVCKNDDTEKQIYEGMIKQQKTQAGSNNYLTDEIETDCMNNFCFGKIMLNLLQYYPCLVGFGDRNEKYHKLQVDFILQDSMGATKKLIKQYFTFYILYTNNLDFIKDYWIKYSQQFDECIPNWENSTLVLQKLFQSLHMIDLLQEVSSHLKYQEALVYMKHFLEKIFVKIWETQDNDVDKYQKYEKQIQKNDMYYFQNYLNIPSIYAAFYKNYIKTYLYTLGFDEVFTQNTIYDYLKELKYCLQMTQMENYQNTLNIIFKQHSPSHPVSQQNTLQNIDQQFQKVKNNPSLVEINNQIITNEVQNQVPSQAFNQTATSQNTNQVNPSSGQNNQTISSDNSSPIYQQETIDALQILNQQDQDRIDEINLVSQEFPFALDGNIQSGQIDDDIINEQLLAMQQDENEGDEEVTNNKKSNFKEERKQNEEQLQLKDNFKNIQNESNQNSKKNEISKKKIIDLFESLKELQYGLKADGAIITAAYVFQQGIKLCGLVENKLCNQQSLSLFMGRDIPIIINDATQYLMTNTYYKAKWKNSYNQFPLSQANLHTSLSKYLSKLPTENSKFSLLKEVNKVALYQYEKVMQKIQQQFGLDNQNDKQFQRNIYAGKSKTTIQNLEQEKVNKSQKKIQISNETNNKFNNDDNSPISKTLNKSGGNKKRLSQQKISSIDQNKDQKTNNDDLDQELFENLNENDEQEILNHFIKLQKNEENQNMKEIQIKDNEETKIQTSEEIHILNSENSKYQNNQEKNVDANSNQIKDIIIQKKKEINNLLQPISDLKMRKKFLLILARHYYYDIQYVCQCIKESLANNSQSFVKNLFEFLAPLNDDIYLSQEILSMQKASEQNVEIVKTFIQLFSPYFTGQNLLKTLPFKDDPTNHYKVSTTGKEYNFLSNRNPYTIDQQSKNKFDNSLANTIVEQKKKLEQLNDAIKIKNQVKNNKKQQSLDSTAIMKQYLSPSNLQESDFLLKEQTINVYLTSSNQKYSVKLKKKYFDLIFCNQFENSLIQFSHRLIDIALAMQDQLSSEDDYVSSIQNNLDQYEFLLVFIHNFENRRYLMEQLKRRMEGLNQSQQNKKQNDNLDDNQQSENENLYQFNEFQLRNFQKDELRTMLSNRYLIFLNILINNNEGVYELFLESGSQSKQKIQKVELVKQDSINENYFNEKPDQNFGSMVQNFIRDMGRSEHIIKSIQYQKSIKSNYKQFVTFYTMWFDRSFLYFKESYEPFLTQFVCKEREKSLNQFILNEDFIKTYTTMLLNDLTSTNYKTKVNFHIEKIIISLNKSIIYALIKEISFVLVEQIEPIVNKLLDSIKRVYKQMKTDSGGNIHNLEKIDNNERDTYYNVFQQQIGKYVENLHSKCDKQFYLIKYMNNVFKIMLQQHLQRDQPLFYQDVLQQSIQKAKTETQNDQLNQNNTLNQLTSNMDLTSAPIPINNNIIQDIKNNDNNMNQQLKDNQINTLKIHKNSNSPYFYSNNNINSSSSLQEGQFKLNSTQQLFENRQYLKESNYKQVFDAGEKQFNREKSLSINNNMIISDDDNQIKIDIYQEQVLNSLKNYEECIKDNYEEILFDSGFFNLYSKILIFSKYYSISLQAGLIYNDRQSKYFSCYAYFSRSYQSLFYLYKIIHSNHHTQAQHILNGDNKNGEVEEFFEFPSQNSIEQNLPLITQLQNSSSIPVQNSQAPTAQNSSQSAQQNISSQQEQKQTEEQKKEYEFSKFLKNIQYEQMQQTVSSVSLQEKEEISTPKQNSYHLKQNNKIETLKQDDKQIKKETQNFWYQHADQKSSKFLRTSHNLEDFDDEDLLGLNTMSAQELNLNCSFKYHELFKFFIKLENVIYFCIVRQSYKNQDIFLILIVNNIFKKKSKMII